MCSVYVCVCVCEIPHGIGFGAARRMPSFLKNNVVISKSYELFHLILFYLES